MLRLIALGEVPDLVAGLDAGVYDYPVEPFAVAELRARVRALLRRSSEDKSPLLRAGDVVLNPIDHEVRVNTHLIELTRREYSILEYLMRNKNRSLSKGVIAEHIRDQVEAIEDVSDDYYDLFDLAYQKIVLDHYLTTLSVIDSIAADFARQDSSRSIEKKQVDLALANVQHPKIRKYLRNVIVTLVKNTIITD